MKIVHVTSAHPWNDVRIFTKMAVSSAEEGHEVHIVAIDRLSSEIRVFRQKDVQVHALSGADITGRVGRAIRGAKRATTYAAALQPDILHFHDPELAPWVAATKLNRGSKVWDVHENLPDQIKTKAWIPAFAKPVVGAAVAITERVLASAFDGIITATPRIAERFPQSKTVVIYNYPRLDEYSFSEVLLPDNVRVVYVGGITEPRGIVKLIEAVEICDEVDYLDLAGTVSPPEFYNQLAKMPGWRKVIYHGVIDRQKVADLLRRARIGAVTLLPYQSYLDSHPIKMLEYLAVGLPVLASNFPLWKQLLAGLDGVEFVDPTSPESIADGIRKILTVPSGEAGMRAAQSRSYVEKQANWPKEEAKLQVSYLSIHGRKA